MVSELFYEFVCFLLLLTSNFNLWWSEKMQDVIFLLFVDTSFISKYVVNFGESSVRFCEGSSFFELCKMFC